LPRTSQSTRAPRATYERHRAGFPELLAQRRFATSGRARKAHSAQRDAAILVVQRRRKSCTYLVRRQKKGRGVDCCILMQVFKNAALKCSGASWMFGSTERPNSPRGSESQPKLAHLEASTCSDVPVETRFSLSVSASTLRLPLPHPTPRWCSSLFRPRPLFDQPQPDHRCNNDARAVPFARFRRS
jgi:hypothetical protein